MPPTLTETGGDARKGQRGDTAGIVVLGAGLTGLSASYFLRKAGLPHRLIERAPAVGGHATTTEEQGYRFDKTGHLLHLRDSGVRALVQEWLGPQLLEVSRKSVVWSNGVYTDYPFQANTYGLPKEVAFECVMGFLRARDERAERPAPKNFAEYCVHHFGEGIAKHFMIPYNARLWGVSPETITAEWCARFVPVPSVEDVLRGALGVPTTKLGYNASFLYPRRGIGALCDAFAERAAPAETEQAVEAIDLSSRTISIAGTRTRFERIVSSIPLDKLLGLLSPASVPSEVLAAKHALRATHLYYLDVALNTPCERDVHWVYVPEDRYPFYRVGCYSNFSSAMAPVGKACLYVELATREAPKLAALLPEVAAGLVDMGLIRDAHAIRFARLRRIEPAYVIFDEHHASATRTAMSFLAAHGIASTGRYGGWNYSSMEDAIVFGREAALSVINTWDRTAIDAASLGAEPLGTEPPTMEGSP